MFNNFFKSLLGLINDTPYSDQPQGSVTFALNSVDETLEGDMSISSTENSNQLFASIPNGFVVIGQEYMGDGDTAVLLANLDETVSLIGILKSTGNLEIHVDDTNSGINDKLGFKVSKPIDVIYRLRRGCKRTIYFTDDNERPRYYDFDSPQNFKFNGDWVERLFSLQKEYKDIPAFGDIEVLDTGGQLEPGSLNVTVQLLDRSLNPTEHIIVSPTLKIYNDSFGETFRDIRGSVNSDVDYLNFPATSKSVKVTLNNLDQTFPYYRLTFIESNSANGNITSVRYSEIIPTTKRYFIYTGQNYVGTGTVEEVQAVIDTIFAAKNILQNENTLFLSNTKGFQANLCNLQKYASRIKVDCELKEVNLTDIKDPCNPKNPSHSLNGVGYMPGEMYSTGIVYVFEGGILSPVYHIPGKSPSLSNTTQFESGDNIRPMRTDNSIASSYVDNITCGSGSIWGKDSEGNDLVGQPIRHHRFPTRSQINETLVTIQDAGSNSHIYYQAGFKIDGVLKVPTAAVPDTNNNVFSIRMSYTINGSGEVYYFTKTISSSNYGGTTAATYALSEEFFSRYHATNDFTLVSMEITNIDGDFVDATTFDHSIYFTTPAITYTTLPLTETNQDSLDRTVTTKILGLRYSGIDLPSLEDTDGIKVIGYFIVRNERTDFEKTILDTAVMLPTTENNNYTSYGLVQPETSAISNRVYAYISPEHKFLNKRYLEIDTIVQQGNFDVIDRKYGKITYNDVYDGTSYNSKYQKGGNDDGDSEDNQPHTRGLDGWCLDVITRDNITEYKNKNSFTIVKDDIDELFYLGGLENKVVNDNSKIVYNISTDNQVGMLNLKDSASDIPAGNNLPYVILKRENTEAYANFRNLPYYRENYNVKLFNSTGDTDSISVFAGDVYVTPMRYVSSVFWDNRVAQRAGKQSVLKKVLGAVLVVAGAVLAIFTAGASTLVIGAGIALIGAGALIVNSGIKLDRMLDIYTDEYDKGLRETVKDNWVDAFFQYKNNIYTQTFGFKGNGGTGGSGPSDDSIQWASDCITDLWFESSVNMYLRNGMVSDTPTFLVAPGRIESGNSSPLETWEFFGINYTSSNAERYPISPLEKHMARKLLAFDADRNDNRIYIGLSLGEYYNLNPDYRRTNKEKIEFSLPLDYECCSECQEDFPHRVRASQKSFQEELSDNFQLFLPNNYTDIPGETGEIMNSFVLNGRIFFHTKEALWQLVQNYQERVTDQIVSFIGTGSIFDIPAQRIVDNKGNSAGLQHKWATCRTANSYFFVSSNENRIYEFNGETLNPTSDMGMSKKFLEILPVQADRVFKESTGRDYTYRDNVANPYGTGYILTHDPKINRVLVSKKDTDYENSFDEFEDYDICTMGGQFVVFPNITDTIATEVAAGWEYVGVENCELKFKRDKIVTKIEERTEGVTIPADTVIMSFYDRTSMSTEAVTNLRTTLDAWFPIFKASVNGGDNSITYVDDETAGGYWGTEQWLRYPMTRANILNPGGSVLALVFVDESNPVYHTGSVETVLSPPTATYLADLDYYNATRPSFKSFKAVNYPIVQNNNTCRVYLQHTVAAMEARNMSQAEVDAVPINPYVTAAWDTLKETWKTNSYTGLTRLVDNGWYYKTDRISLVDGNASPGCPVDGVSVITPCTFTQDIQNLLDGGGTETEIIEVEVQYIETEFKTIPGQTIVPTKLNNSWTLSYYLGSLFKKPKWTSFHSYFPNTFINAGNELYTITDGVYSFWKHHVKGSFQRFYGQRYNYIVEYVAKKEDFSTKIWDYLELQTEAKKYSPVHEDFLLQKDVTFNKAIFYNNKQSSGIVNLIVKDNVSENAVVSTISESGIMNVIIDRKEANWFINSLNNIKVDDTLPIFSKTLTERQSEYYIDKVPIASAHDENMDWFDVEPFRDKFLVVRLIFDNFEDVKLNFNNATDFGNLSEI